MKTNLLIALLAFGMNVAAQADFVNHTFTTSLESGYGTSHDLVFELLIEKDSLLKSDPYLEYISHEKRAHIVKDLDEKYVIDAFLKFTLNMTLIKGKAELPYPSTIQFTYDPTLDQAGLIGSIAIHRTTGQMINKISFMALDENRKLSTGSIFTMNKETFILFNE